MNVEVLGLVVSFQEGDLAIMALGIFFSAFALSRVVLRFREGRLSWGMMLVWSFAWLSIIAFLLFQNTFTSLSNAIGVDRPLDFMLIVGVMLSYYLTFRIYIYIEELKSDLAEVVREVAIKKEEKG
ncbi:MAG: DUF2304 family protein [Candidatus Altiarchaeales archaeon]|nr:DUF2304 family protein [Candidatus Altiarchaeales archaeon]MBD3415561.1 DUF2304 family protein [Candidatus Altiarchaeales archaeon]